MRRRKRDATRSSGIVGREHGGGGDAIVGRGQRGEGHVNLGLLRLMCHPVRAESWGEADVIESVTRIETVKT